ncbi:MAG: hypothetical protein M1816_007410 [Peltula sp. TS41687]|nr:MAG: hypothetical protein M1816_007410 [Peltula sp. TS41687]
MQGPTETLSPPSHPVSQPQILPLDHPLKVMHRRLISARETQEFISRRLKFDLYGLTYPPPPNSSSPSHKHHLEHDKCLSSRRYKLRRALVRSTRAERTIINRRSDLESKIQLHERWLSTSADDTRKRSIMSTYNAEDDAVMAEAAATEAWSPYHDSGQPIWLLNLDLPGTPGYVLSLSYVLVPGRQLLGAPTAQNTFIRPTTLDISSPDFAEENPIIWGESLGLVRADGYLYWDDRFRDDDRLEVVGEETSMIVVHDQDEGAGEVEGQGRGGEAEYTGLGFLDDPDSGRRLSGPWYSGFGYDARARRFGCC